MTWQQMIENPDKYLPLITRLVGYYLMRDYRSDPDVPYLKWETIIPEAAALTTDEREFIEAGAGTVYFQSDPNPNAQGNGP
ncbi:hypothetical protein B5V01_21275 [Mesorhizobium erdmanii]|uniref:Uncharacterized protein n=2 Tax=Mesorhizobium TaxID=68287 RepID=A0A3M9X050_9HYPH|nr:MULTISPECIES: hypothetical protein [Mesorhizobium]RNJ41407.1 hypothetical protein DNR46_34320 [Mesorhizobium japonicum]RXT43045.1 hypothetical protein B5V01_21275 [Mesorhizobium erdmanii]